MFSVRPPKRLRCRRDHFSKYRLLTPHGCGQIESGDAARRQRLGHAILLFGIKYVWPIETGLFFGAFKENPRAAIPRDWSTIPFVQ